MKKLVAIFITLFFIIIGVSAQNSGLRVVRVSPTGNTSDSSEYSSIIVEFNEDIVPFGFRDSITNKYLDFNIGIEGSYRFIDSKTLAFYPSATLPKSTKIEVTLKAGFTSVVSSNTLRNDYKWSFNTKRLTFIKSSPYNDRIDVATKENIVLYFSDDVDINSAKNNIKMTNDTDKDINFSVRYAKTNDIREWEIEEYSLESVLVLTPARNYPKNTKINIIMSESLKAKDATIGMGKVQRLQFTTHKEMEVVADEFQQVTADYESKAPNISFSTAVKYKDLLNNIEITPSVELPDTDDDENRYEYSSKNFNLYNISFAPRNTYTIKIKKGLKDIYGQVLNSDYEISLKVDDYNPRFSMPSGFGVVEAYEGRKIPLNLMNPKDVMISSKKVSKEDIIPYLILNGAIDNADKSFYSKRRDLLNYDNTNKADINYMLNTYSISSLYLDSYLGSIKYGLLSIEANTKVGSKLTTNKTKAYIQVTDMGITGKFAGDSNTIFVTELKTGSPLADVDVEIRDDKNKVLYKTKTDKNGIATTPGSIELKIGSSNRWEKARQWAIASKGNDVAFIYSQWGTGVSPWRMNIDYQYDNNYVSYKEGDDYESTSTERNVKAYMFTERGIYKPGEKVHIKGVVREVSKGEWSIASGVKYVYYTITDSRGKEILQGTAEVNNYGSYFIDTDILKDAPTGYYSVAATDKKTFSSYMDFRVDVFKPLEFETRIWNEDREYTLGDNLNANLSGWYLFGEPMKDKRLRYNISLSETTFTPPNNAGFRFSSLTWYEDDYYNHYYNNIASDDTMLDDKGEYRLLKNIDASRNIQAANITLEATVFGEDSQSVSSSRTILFHGADYYLGIRKAGYFVEQNKPTEVQIIATDYKGNKLSDKKVDIVVVHRYWQSVKKAITGGRFQWESEQIDTEIAKGTITTKNTAVSYTFTPEKTGLYFVTITSKDSKDREIKSAEYMYVIGNEYVPWAMFDDDLLETIVEKESYEAGEIARIMVKNPYESATALVTVEREFVIDRYVTNIKGSSALIEVPIKKEYLPNVYIGVALVKGRVEDISYTNYGEDNGKPSFKIGYSSISVSPKEKELNVNIVKSTSETEPGKPVTVDIEVKSKDDKAVESEVMFSVVDIGVLNLINFKTPNWFSSFYGNRPLSVMTSDSRLHIIGQRNYGEKGETPGGDSEARMAMAKSMNDMSDEFSIRKNFLSTAFYKGNVLTDKNGKATITFSMPDNITSFRIMASAIDKSGSFGAGEDIITVKKNLMLMSTTPKFAIVEDKFSAGATLYNYSSKDLDISVMASVSNAKIQQDVVTLKIPKGESKDIRFDIEADNLGEAKLIIMAKGGEYTDAIESIFNVKEPITTEVFSLHSSTDSNSIEIPIAVPNLKDIYRNTGNISLYMSPSAFSESRTSINYLFEYPYGCLEQRLSKAFPIINSKRIMIDMGIIDKTEEELDNVVSQILQDMKDFQDSTGGFAYYTSKTWISPFVSAYATEFLLKAKKEGYSVDEAMLEKATSYLYNYTQNNTPKPTYYSDEYINLSSYAYALAVLAEAGETYNKAITSTLDKIESMPFIGRVYLLKAMYYAKYNATDIERVKSLILNSIKEDSNTAHYELESRYRNLFWIHSSSIRDTALAMSVLIETGNANDKRDQKILRYLVQQKNSKKYLNTQENINIYNAMNQYFLKYESVYPSLKAQFVLSSRTLLESSFEGRREAVVSSNYNFRDIPLYRNNLKDQNAIRVDRDGKGRLYYGVTIKYAPKALEAKKDNGIDITRTIKTTDLKTVDLKNPLVQGKDYIVEIKIKNNFERTFVAVDSGIASGMRIQNTSFANISSDIKEIVADNSYVFNQTEIYEDRVQLFADFMPKGEYVYRYVVRAATPGDYLLQATKAEEMYNPEVFGYDGALRLKIVYK